MAPVFVAVVLSCLFLADAARQEITPVQRVIDLLQGMIEKGSNEQAEEKVEFKTYSLWCQQTEKDRSRSINEGNEKIEMLTAQVSKASADIAQLTSNLADLANFLNTTQTDKALTIETRKEEKATYDKTFKDYSESLEALNNAITTLRERTEGVDQAKSGGTASEIHLLAEVNGTSESAMNMIDAFLAKQEVTASLLQISETPKAGETPQGDAYEFQSGGILKTLDNLLVEFTKERTTLEAEEHDKVNAYLLHVQDCDLNIKDTNRQTDTKTATFNQRSQNLAEFQRDLAETTKSRDDDVAYHTDLVATCNKKQSDFNSRQELRTNELTALTQASDIIGGDAVRGNGDKHFAKLMQVKANSSSTNLARLRAKGYSPAQDKTVAYLIQRASALHSSMLSALVLKAEASPLDKVVTMIRDLIAKLEKESGDENNQNTFCVTQLNENQATRDAKTSHAAQIKAEMDSLNAYISQLTSDSSTLAQEIATLESAMAQATTIRNKENTENTVTIADAKAAQDATARALAILRDFYTKAGGATSFVQADPTIFENKGGQDQAYAGQQAQSIGVLAMLEVIESDFARLEAMTTSQEASALSEFNKFMDESKKDSADKTADKNDKDQTALEKTQALALATSDYNGTMADLQAANAYYETLKPQCSAPQQSHEDRAQARKDELDSLQTALTTLESSVQI